MNLYYKVEAAFDGMADALKAAMNVADNSEETELYSDLADECIGLLDKAHRDLTNLIIKKAAPAVSATEAAKNDSDKESISSVAENGENVKPFGILRIERTGEHEAKSTISLQNKSDLPLLYACAVESCIVAAAENGYSPEDIDQARKRGEKHALNRLTKIASDLLKEILGGAK